MLPSRSGTGGGLPNWLRFLLCTLKARRLTPFATALWPERRVPVQTLANRLSETRRALGLAGDGRPRLRKMGRRHLIVDAETDWDQFKDLSGAEQGPACWRKALALVRGRPLDGLDRGEWAQLEGFTPR